MRFVALCLGFLGAVVAACGPTRYVNPSPPAAGEEAVVAVWVDPQSGLPEDVTLAGCNLWNPKGVRCVLAANIIESDVAFVADRSFCGVNEDGTRYLAFASPYMVVSVRVDCFYDDAGPSGVFDREQYLAVAGHEVGHVLGIWGHVPASCDGISVAGPDGTRPCGDALMNPSTGPSLQYLTPADSAAFDLRDRTVSALPPSARQPRDRPGGDMSSSFTDCVLIDRPSSVP